MSEAQLLLFPVFAALPIFDESDERAHTFMAGHRKNGTIRECTRMEEVENCLKNPKFVPLGAVRFGTANKALVVYFGEQD